MSGIRPDIRPNRIFGPTLEIINFADTQVNSSEDEIEVQVSFDEDDTSLRFTQLRYSNIYNNSPRDSHYYRRGNIFIPEVLFISRSKF